MQIIGSGKQLFIDNRFIESSEGLTLTMNPPQQPSEPVFVADRPWEKLGVCMYNTVIREEDGKFRMWYGAMMKCGLPKEGAIRLCYAESNDGINWVRPSLGLIEFEGSKDNNIVAPLEPRQSMQGACVYRDDRAPESERYKLMTKFRPSDQEVEKGAMSGLWSMYSPDGIHWSYYPDQPNPVEQVCDTQNMFWWDETIERYVCYTRDWRAQQADEAAEFDQAKSIRFRAVARMTSEDFRTWTEAEQVFRSDDKDLAMTVPAGDQTEEHNVDFYNSCAIKYPYAQDVYLMFPSAYYHWTKDMMPATFDVQLLTSRNGINWQRQGDRAPFLRPGLSGSASSSMIMANPWLIPANNELWLYYSGTSRRHGQAEDVPFNTGIYRSMMRTDGFVSLDAGFDSGEFTTPILSFDGDQLKLNYDGSAGGWLKVELQDQDGQPIDGFALADADTMTGNHLTKAITWKGKSSLERVKGQNIKMRVVMRGMKLYAFQFEG